MATQTPGNLYTGGAVVFDSRPHTHFAINLMARQKAKDEAIEQYYRTANQAINPAGVRIVDMPEFENKVNSLRKFWSDHADKIKNPMKHGAAAQTEYQRLYQDAINHVQQSKAEEEKIKPLLGLFADPDKRSRVTDKTLIDIDYHNLPLNDPNRKSFDISSLSFDPKPLVLSNYIKLFEHIKPNEEKVLGQTDMKTMQRPVTTKFSYSQDAVRNIYAIAASEYMSNDSFKAEIDKAMGSPDAYERLNETFKKNFGENIETAEDFAAAYSIDILKPAQTKIDFETDQFSKDKQMQAIRQANAKELINLRKSLSDSDEEVQEVWIDSYLDKIEESGKPVLSDFGQGKEIPLDPVLARALTIGTGADAITPEKLIVTDDRYIPIFYVEGYGDRQKSDKFPAINKELSKPITRQQMKLALGVKAASASQRTKEMRSTSKPKVGILD